MPGEDSVFVPGASLSPTFGVAATLIEQAIRNATPNEYRGMVIRSNTPPAVTGAPAGYPTNWFAFQIRSIWINDNGEAYFHDGTTWQYIRGRPAYNSITNDMIENGSLMLGKLSTYGGATAQIIRVRAAGGFEYVDAINAISANTLPVDRIVSPATAGTYVLQSVGGVKSWVTFNSAFVNAALTDNSVPVNRLARGAALQVPMVAADGNSVTWVAAISAIPDNAITLAKLAVSVGDAGKFLKYGSDGKVIPADNAIVGTTAALVTGDKIIALTASNTTKNATIGRYDSGLIPLTLATAKYEAAHSLGVVPSIAQAYLECITAEHGYSPGDRITLENVYWEQSNNQRTLFYFMTNSSIWSLTAVENAQSTLTPVMIYNRNTGVITPFTYDRWRIRVILTAF